MAAEATASTTTLKLMVEKGTGKDGQPLYAARSVPGISPDLTDEAVKTVMQKMIDKKAVSVGGEQATEIKEAYIRISDREKLA